MPKVKTLPAGVTRLPKVKLELVKMNVPQRVAAVMQDRAMSIPEVEAALKNAGETFKSDNLRSYISTTLNSSTRAMTDGQGRNVRVHYFVSQERGVYRVATPEDIQREIQQPRTTAVLKSKPAPKAKRPPPRDATATSAARSAFPADAADVSLRSLIQGVLRAELSASVRSELRVILKDELRAIFKNGLG